MGEREDSGGIIIFQRYDIIGAYEYHISIGRTKYDWRRSRKKGGVMLQPPCLGDPPPFSHCRYDPCRVIKL